jgi:FkbM family methyltransferase
MSAPDLSHLGGSDGGAGTNLPDIFERLVQQLDLCSVIDIGCGEGNGSKWWHDRGLYVLGVDGFPEYIANNRLPREHLHLHDYTQGPFVPDMTFDLGWSSEFVEHVEARFVPNFMATFARCKHACITFATPGQGGYHHVNEQLEAYWIGKFSEAGFDLDREATEQMRDTGRNTGYGRRTLTLFHARLPVVPVATEDRRTTYPLDGGSVVVDAGGYMGNWCRPIAAKYGCRVEVFEPVKRFRDTIHRQEKGEADLSALLHLRPAGLSDKAEVARFHVQNDSTGAYAASPETEEVALVDVRELFAPQGEFAPLLTRVDLMKLNIEGGEYAVLGALIETGLIKRIRYLQVQWHGPVWCAAPFPGTAEMRRKLKGQLFKTHRTMWESPWVWESYELKP